MNKFKRERVIETPEEMNKIIKTCKSFNLVNIKIGKGGDYKSMNEYVTKHGAPSLFFNNIIELSDTKLKVSTKYYGDLKPTTYIFSLNLDQLSSKSGQQCFAQLQKCYKIPRASSYNIPEVDRWFDNLTGKYICSSSPILSFNPKYCNKELYDVYEYDLNSAYTSAILTYIPDLNKPKYEPGQKVKKGYVGFFLDDFLTMSEVGKIADITFPLIETPKSLKDFCERWYNKKRDSIGQDKTESKAMLNLPIGYSQRYNPFFRAYIVQKCNEKIAKIIDKDTLFWNTDAIFSKTRRKDLKIGNGIGEFKEIHFNRVRYIDNSYQCDDEIPKYRHIPKQWFKQFEKEHNRPYNLLLDPTPPPSNLYTFNFDTLELKENKYDK